ncbi:MAG: hypothetical protein ACXWXC_05805 [Aeromicrobium sp.]
MISLAFAVLTASEKPLDPNDVKPGYVALLIVILMCVATFLLLRNFVKHTRKASQPWEGEDDGTKQP